MQEIVDFVIRKDRAGLVSYIVAHAMEGHLRQGDTGEVARLLYQGACVGLAMLDGDDTGELSSTFELLCEQYEDALADLEIPLQEVAMSG